MLNAHEFPFVSVAVPPFPTIAGVTTSVRFVPLAQVMFQLPTADVHAPLPDGGEPSLTSLGTPVPPLLHA